MLNTSEARYATRKGKPVLVVKLTGKEKFFTTEKGLKEERDTLTGKAEGYHKKIRDTLKSLEKLQKRFWDSVYAEFDRPETYKDMVLELDRKKLELILTYPQQHKEYENFIKNHEGHGHGMTTHDTERDYTDKSGAHVHEHHIHDKMRLGEVPFSGHIMIAGDELNGKSRDQIRDFVVSKLREIPTSNLTDQQLHRVADTIVDRIINDQKNHWGHGHDDDEEED